MDYEPITKELRELMSYQAVVGTDTFKSRVAADPDAFDAACDNIDAVHRSLEQENERLRDASKRGDDWIKLPVDADGVPIRANDELFWEQDGTSAGRVTAIGVGERAGWVWLLHDGSNVSIGRQVNKVCHRKPDTFERIIEDAIDTHGNGFNPSWTDERDKLIARCKALAGEGE